MRPPVLMLFAITLVVVGIALSPQGLSFSVLTPSFVTRTTVIVPTVDPLSESPPRRAIVVSSPPRTPPPPTPPPPSQRKKKKDAGPPKPPREPLPPSQQCKAIGGCENACADRATVEQSMDWSSLRSTNQRYYFNTWKVNNVCTYNGGALFYFSPMNDASWHWKVYGDIGLPIAIPLTRYDATRHAPLPSKVRWSHDVTVIHTIPHRYFQNLAHTSDYLAAQINAVGRYPGVDFPKALQTEWVFLMNDLQRRIIFEDKDVNIYQKFTPVVAPTCRTIYEIGSRPYPIFDDATTPVRCFREAIVGLELFLINNGPQNFTMYRQALEHWDPQCPPPRGKPTKLLVIYRKHEYRTVVNIEEVTAALASTLGFVSENIQMADFANMTLKAQACAARNAKVMFGMFGAGLTWAMALQPGAILFQVCSFDHKCPWYLNIAKSVKAVDINYIPGSKEMLSMKYHTIRMDVRRLIRAAAQLKSLM